MKNNEELKPCPFCGADAEMDIVGIDDGKVTIECSNNKCFMSRFGFEQLLSDFGDTDTIIKLWNTRK